MRNKRNQKGFSLIELLIVVAIILIIAAIAIPNLMKSKQAANEGSAVSILRTLSTSEVTYSINNNGAFGTVAELATANLIESGLDTAGKNGYKFTAAAGETAGTWSASATADAADGKHYCVDQTNVIRKLDAAITAGDACTGGTIVGAGAAVAEEE